jgi:SNF2 family DNA or RNA helicase
VDGSAWAILSKRGGGSLLEVEVTVRAFQLAMAEQFEELLALPTMADVESWPYQVETVRRVLRTFRGRALLADEVGLGKTVEALTILREYQLRGMVKRALVLVPPALVNQWRGELREKAHIVPHDTEDPGFRADPRAFWGQEGVFIASLGLVRLERHAEFLRDQPFDLVVVDEAHHLKNRSTLGFKLVNALQSRFLLMLTATPVETDLEELYNLVTLLKPGQFSTLADFKKRHVDPKDPTSPKNRERLRALLAEVMVRNTRAQCGLKLPPRYVTTVLVDPLPGEQALYDAILREFRENARLPRARPLLTTLLLEAGSSPAAVVATLDKLRRDKDTDRDTRLRLTTLADLGEGLTGSRKLEALLSLVGRPGSRTLVFSRFRETLRAASQALEAAHVPHVTFHGGLDRSGKHLAVTRFKEGCPVMLATDVGAEGVNLQFCHDLVNLDLPWNPMVLEQRMGRLHRMGQEHEVRVTNLCARGTVEERVLDVLDRRVNLFQLVVGEMDMVLGNLADDRDFQERILDLYATAPDQAAIDAGFDALAQDLLKARGRYEHTRKLEDALFGKDFTT